MLNYMTIWSGWIAPAITKDRENQIFTKSEFATFERMVLKAEKGVTAPPPSTH